MKTLQKNYHMYGLIIATTLFSLQCVHAEEFSIEDIENVTVDNKENNPSVTDIVTGLPSLITLLKMQYIDEPIESYPLVTLTISSLLTLWSISTNKITTAALTLLFTGYPLYKSGSIVYETYLAQEETIPQQTK